jgi:hypothetical protein
MYATLAGDKNTRLSSKLGTANVLPEKKIHVAPSENYSNIERLLFEANLPELANLAKTLRQLNPYPRGSIRYKIWWEQAQFNVPILILSSLFLNEWCQKEKINTIFFTQRDCYHWIKIFHKLFPNYDVIDFMASRKAYYNPSQEYIQYVQNLCHGRFIAVDVAGSGASCQDFFKKYFHLSPLHLAIARCGSLYPGVAYVPESSDHLEQLNYAPFGTLLSFNSKGPVRAFLEYPIDLIEPATACVACAIQILEPGRFRASTYTVVKTLITAINMYEPALERYHVHFHTAPE